MKVASTTRRSPGRPRDEALQERRREEILARAASTFATHGYPNTDVQWVADALGISKGTVYRYFPTKKELFLAAVRRGVGRLHAAIDAATAGIDDGVEMLTTSIRAYLRFFASNPELAELFVQERAEFKESHTPVYFAMRGPRRARVRGKIRGLITGRRLRAVPVQRILDVMGDVLYGTIFANHLAGARKPHATQALDVLDILYHGILTPSERARRSRLRPLSSPSVIQLKK